MSQSDIKKPRFHFPTQSFLSPQVPLDDDAFTAKPTTPKSVVQTTHFANLFRGWQNAGRVGYDAVVHEAFQQVVQEWIEKSASVRMVMQDVSKSALATGAGVAVEVKTINALSDKLLEISLIKEITCALGLSDYVDDIVSIELSKAFGSATSLARKKNQKQEDDAEWMRKTAAGMHNMLRDISSSLKSSKFMPKPVSQTVQAKARRHIMAQIEEETEDQNTNNDGGPRIPKPS